MARRIVEHAGHTLTDEPTDVVVLGGDGPERSTHREPSRSPTSPAEADRRGASRRWFGFVALLALVASAAIVVSGVGDPTDDPAPDPEPDTGVAVLTPGELARPVGPWRIDPDALVEAPLEALVTVHWPTALDLSVPRVHSFTIRQGSSGAVALLQVDATRRAKVRGEGDLRAVDGRALPAPTRVMVPTRPSGPVVWEWDTVGYGVSMAALGFDDAELAAFADALRTPLDRSLIDDGVPFLDLHRLPQLDLTVSRRASAPATIIGGPLIGQGGLGGVEAWLYRVDGPDAGSYLLVGTRDRQVRAADLVEAFGDAVRIDPPAPSVQVAAALESTTGQLVGGRITGRTRVLLDHRSGVVFELASDVLDVERLLREVDALDLERFAASVPQL